MDERDPMLRAMPRESGVPARVRAGFAGYFTAGLFDRGRRLVDAQVAGAPATTYTDADIDPLDVPRDAFVWPPRPTSPCSTR